MNSHLPEDKNLKSYFFDHKVFTSEPRSGNFAMFIAVILIYARDWLKIDTQNQINYWVESHIKNLNKYSLWGNNDFYSQYQSSYHQYEIFNYLKIDIFDNKKLIRKIGNLKTTSIENGISKFVEWFLKYYK